MLAIGVIFNAEQPGIGDLYILFRSRRGLPTILPENTFSKSFS